MKNELNQLDWKNELNGMILAGEFKLFQDIEFTITVLEGINTVRSLGGNPFCTEGIHSIYINILRMNLVLHNELILTMN
jgi:hypothetical protein